MASKSLFIKMHIPCWANSSLSQITRGFPVSDWKRKYLCRLQFLHFFRFETIEFHSELIAKTTVFRSPKSQGSSVPQFHVDRSGRSPLDSVHPPRFEMYSISVPLLRWGTIGLSIARLVQIQAHFCKQCVPAWNWTSSSNNFTAPFVYMPSNHKFIDRAPFLSSRFEPRIPCLPLDQLRGAAQAAQRISLWSTFPRKLISWSFSNLPFDNSFFRRCFRLRNQSFERSSVAWIKRSAV